MIASHAPDDPLLHLEGFDLERLDAGLTDGERAVAELERLQSEGAEFAVFPKPLLWWLENQVPELQARLEITREKALLRDGGVCAIYALD